MSALARTPSPRRAAVCALAAALAAGPAAAPAFAQALRVEPSIGAQQTFTSNGSLERGDRRSDSITQLSPGVKAALQSGRSSASLDYRLDAVSYARDNDRSELRHFLSADGSTELVDNHVFLDASASVSQQSISAFGQQTTGTGLSNDNVSEVATLTLAPRARARLAGLVDVQADANWTKSRSDGSGLGDTTDWDASLSLGARHGLFGWDAALTRRSSDYDDGARLLSNSAVGTLSVSPNSRLRLFVRGGRERADYSSRVDAEDSTTSGWGVEWQPTPRTRLSAYRDDRYFGNAHGFTLTHRFRRAVLSFSDSRGVSGENLESLGPLRQVYLRLYTLCMASVNNAAYCTQFTRAALGFDPTQSLGFLASAPSLDRTQALALSASGTRNSFAVSYSRSTLERLQQFDYTGGDLALVPRVRQTSLSFNASHRLTPSTSLSLGLSTQRTLDEPELAGNEQRRVEIGLSNELGPRTSGTLSVRHVRFDSETSPYRESALIGSLNHRF